MTRQQKAKIISEEFDRLYPEPAVPLTHRNNFTFLVAVLLSAQCTDKRVNEVTPKLFDMADSPEKMANLPVEKILEIVRPCGLSQNKSKNISALSKILCQKFNSEVPSNFKDLESLPGVGHKTASVLMVQAFGTPAFPVDTHIHRLAQRWGLSSGKNVEETERDLKKIFPQNQWGKLHLQFIHYGRNFCKAHTCKTPETMCEICRKVGRKL